MANKWTNNTTQVKAGNNKLTVHRVVNDDGSLSHCISDSGGWLPGSFDSVESCIEGFKFLKRNQWDLTDRLRDINHYKKGNRSITIKDLTQCQ
jgi:hypothetical protein